MKRILFSGLRGLQTTTISLVGFGAGFGLFARPWASTEDKTIQDQEWDLVHRQQQMSIMEEIKSSSDFQKRFNDPNYEFFTHSKLIPKDHRPFQVMEGIFSGPEKLVVEPIVLINKKDGEFASFSHLGPSMTGKDGKIHNGVIATIIDEGLCFCGFAKLPSKRGVTAKLSIDFKEHAKPNSTVVLTGKVVQTKGRKVVIEGIMKTLPQKKNEKSEIIANSTCILVEPKWFKYLSWVPMF